MRALFRLAVLSAATAVLYAVVGAGSLALGVAGRPSGRWRARLMRTWARATVRILGVHVRVEGRPPRPPFLLVSNHLSYLDVPVLAAQGGAAFVAKREVALWPGVGALARSAGTLFIDRERKRDVPRVVGDMERALSEGVGVVFFPEGTSSDGAEVLPFRPPLLEPAARSGRPVHAASVTYDVPPGWPSARTSVCWWGDMTLPRHLWKLLALPRIDATVRYAAGTVAGADRKVLAESLNSCVRSLHHPVPS